MRFGLLSLPKNAPPKNVRIWCFSPFKYCVQKFSTFDFYLYNPFCKIFNRFEINIYFGFFDVHICRIFVKHLSGIMWALLANFWSQPRKLLKPTAHEKAQKETNIIYLTNCCWFLKNPIDCCCLGGWYWDIVHIQYYIPVDDGMEQVLGRATL
jgi:hypothetical protein